MEETSSPPLSGHKFNFFYFLPEAMSPDPTPRTPSPSPKKRMKKKITVILRRPSMRINNKGSFRFKEPRSPKVSCIGKVANNGKKKDRKKKKKRENDREGKEQTNVVAISPPNLSFILKLLKVFKKEGTKLANPYAESSSPPAAAASIKSVPKLGNAKKVFVRFDWRVHDSSPVAPDRPSSLPNKKEKRKDVVVVENIELVPRKEINLWKKRMVAPPPPLLV